MRPHPTAAVLKPSQSHNREESQSPATLSSPGSASPACSTPTPWGPLSTGKFFFSLECGFQAAHWNNSFPLPKALSVPYRQPSPILTRCPLRPTPAWRWFSLATRITICIIGNLSSSDNVTFLKHGFFFPQCFSLRTQNATVPGTR